MANIETRTVQSAGINCQSMISGNSFIIKEYQRGYRWESQQVENLLQDLQEQLMIKKHLIKLTIFLKYREQSI